jgi:Uncharacterized protein conserved in bacteria (DUF2171)
MLAVVDLGEPSSYIALKAGAAVVASDGEQIGTVEHVLGDTRRDIFDGLVVDIGAGPGGQRFADAEHVDEIYEGGVVLKLTAAEVETLPKPSPSPAVMEAHGSADTEGPLERKLRRAWDLISGKY